MIISCPEVLDDTTFETLVNALPATAEASLVIDALSTRFIEPFGLVHLLTLGGYYRSLELRLPNSHVVSYLRRMNFMEVSEAFLTVTSGEDNANTWSGLSSNILLEVTTIRQGADMRNMLPVIRERTAKILSSYGYDETDLHRFCTAVSELSQNIPRHSQSIGWIAIQKYIQAHDSIKIAIADAGVGIPATLAPKYRKRNPRQWSDAKALQLAVTQGISRFENEDCGHGLAVTGNYIYNWNASMFIRSGTAKLEISSETGPSGRTIDRLPFCPGTQISIVLPRRSPERDE